MTDVSGPARSQVAGRTTLGVMQLSCLNSSSTAEDVQCSLPHLAPRLNECHVTGASSAMCYTNPLAVVALHALTCAAGCIPLFPVSYQPVYSSAQRDAYEYGHGHTQIAVPPGAQFLGFSLQFNPVGRETSDQCCQHHSWVGISTLWSFVAAERFTLTKKSDHHSEHTVIPGICESVCYVRATCDIVCDVIAIRDALSNITETCDHTVCDVKKRKCKHIFPMCKMLRVNR